MYKTTTGATLAILLALGAPAFAQTVPSAPPRAEANTPANAIQPDQFRASKMLGSTVYDAQNQNIGSVKDIVLDRDGRVAAVVLDVGSFLGMGGKYVAVRLSEIKTGNNRLTLDMTKQQLQQAQAYQLEERNTGAGTTTGPATGGHLGSGR
ncbi:MAG TPA: PRC-barrel domain-containing protein [Stellaceae bacterium]|nr:PRC-barrel domain-containing protein [Stellaceae bacterium]